MTTPSPRKFLTERDRAEVRRLHGEGLGRNDIARAIGRSAATVTKVAKELGLAFDREATKVAVAAAMVDAKAKRAKLMNDLLDDAERLRAQLFAPTTLHNFGGKDNTYNSRDVAQPTFRDQRDIVGAVSAAANASMRLDHHDTDGGAEGARGMVTGLFAALGVAYDQMAAAEQEEAPGDEGG